MTKIKTETREIIIDPAKTKKRIIEYHEQPYEHKFDNLDEGKQLLIMCKLPYRMNLK